MRVWLDDPGADTGGHHSALCATHAGRLRPPVGWSCQDRRTARPSTLPPPTQQQQQQQHPQQSSPAMQAPPAIAV
jgi:hypothetical protein